MSLLSPAVTHPPADALKNAAVALCNRGRHAGLLFRNPQGVWFLHLADYCDLRCEQSEIYSDLHWAEPDWTPTIAALVSLFAARVASENKCDDITYGLDRSDCRFDPFTGQFVAGEPGTGLTCASLVWSILRALSLDPLLMKSWRADADDERFGRQVLGHLTGKLGAAHPHVVGMSHRVASPRIRPGDVAAAAVTPTAEWPVPFEQIRATAAPILQQVGA